MGGVGLSALVGEVVPGAHADLCDLVKGHLALFGLP